jgi:hypothetical protein
VHRLASVLVSVVLVHRPCFTSCLCWQLCRPTLQHCTTQLCTRSGCSHAAGALLASHTHPLHISPPRVPDACKWPAVACRCDLRVLWGHACRGGRSAMLQPRLTRSCCVASAQAAASCTPPYTPPPPPLHRCRRTAAVAHARSASAAHLLHSAAQVHHRLLHSFSGCSLHDACRTPDACVAPIRRRSHCLVPAARLLALPQPPRRDRTAVRSRPPQARADSPQDPAPFQQLLPQSPPSTSTASQAGNGHALQPGVAHSCSLPVQPSSKCRWTAGRAAALVCSAMRDDAHQGVSGPAAVLQHASQPAPMSPPVHVGGQATGCGTARC